MSEQQAERIPVFTRRASRKARSLTPLAGLLGVVLITNALIGLFGLHYANKGTVANFAELDVMMTDLDMVRRARGHFKVQVQEWKNVLLRQSIPTLRDHHWSGFEEQEAATRDTLRALADQSDDGTGGLLTQETSAIESMLVLHETLGQEYRTALTSAEDDPEGFSAKRADDLVRGRDRPLDEALDTLALDLFKRARLRQAEMLDGDEDRYDALRQTAMWGLAVCVVLVGAFLMLAVRGDRGARQP